MNLVVDDITELLKRSDAGDGQAHCEDRALRTFVLSLLDADSVHDAELEARAAETVLAPRYSADHPFRRQLFARLNQVVAR